MTPVVALTIAGSDSGGAAGIQADLKTFAAHGVYGTSALTAVTAQNTTGVRAVTVLEPEAVDAQITAVLEDFEVRAVKTGMLAERDIVELVARRAAAGELPNLVVDPVMVASSGDTLLEPDAIDAYRQLLLPHAEVTTPNLREAEVLLDRRLRTVEELQQAAADLLALGPRWVVVKGGHLRDSATDVVAGADGRSAVLPADRIDTMNTHGTGCSFASALTAGLAAGTDPLRAAAAAKTYVDAAIRGGAGWHLGAGHGPIDHLGWGDT